ncbi:MAG: PAS domain S-box protein [Rhodoferax sp.]|nr:PAS domain S-box protein [Rhodoferax sp.]
MQSSPLENAIISIIDVNDTVITFNTAVEQIFGHKESDVLTRTRANLIIPLD